MNDIKNLINENNKIFEKYYNNGDVKSVAKLYTDEGRLYPPGTNGSIYQGHEAIEGFWNKAFEGGVKNLKLTVDRVTQSGDDRLIEESQYEHSLGYGRYIVIWNKENGVWKLEVDIFNT